MNKNHIELGLLGLCGFICLSPLPLAIVVTSNWEVFTLGFDFSQRQHFCLSPLVHKISQKLYCIFSSSLCP